MKTPPAKIEEWTNVSPVDYLVSAGLSKVDAECVVKAAGIESMTDVSLLANDNGALLTQLVQETGLKLIPAKKLSNAVKALGEDRKIDDKDQERSKQDTKSVTLDECVVIAIDRSCSMGAGFEEAKASGPNAEKTLARRSRMDAVKQCFSAFRDRTDALEDSKQHALGLIQFDDRVEKMSPLTVDLDRFEAVVDDLQPRASTAIYSAVLHGCSMLKPYHESSPESDLRILVLTDGLNNAGVTPQEAFKEVAELGVVVDAILVGDALPDKNLRKIVAASGGTCFQINSLSEGFELMEAEAVVSLKSRRGGGVMPLTDFIQSGLRQYFSSTHHFCQWGCAGIHRTCQPYRTKVGSPFCPRRTSVAWDERPHGACHR
jgi:Mg-chelatase subunit ChlD